MRFETKIAIAVRADLEQWQKLNVTAFLASGIAAAAPEVMGKPYEDGSGTPTWSCSASRSWSTRPTARR